MNSLSEITRYKFAAKMAKIDSIINEDINYKSGWWIKNYTINCSGIKFDGTKFNYLNYIIDCRYSGVRSVSELLTHCFSVEPSIRDFDVLYIMVTDTYGAYLKNVIINAEE